MVLETVDIPQADALWHVARVPEAILSGATTTEAIGAYLGTKGPRQGRYYTQAARVLGLVEGVAADGTVQISAYGRAFARYSLLSQGRALRHRMVLCEPTCSVIAALIARGPLDLDEIGAVLRGLAPLSESTAYRRAQTIIAWLRDLQMATWRDGRLHYTGPRLLNTGAPRPTSAGLAAQL